MFGGSGGTTAAIGGVAGIAVGGAVVAAAYEASSAKQRLMDKYVNEEHKAQIGVVYTNLQEHLGQQAPTADALNEYRATHTELLVLSPAFPQVKQAFDAILAYQRQRTGRGFTGCSCIGRNMVTESDPQAVVCELMKAWLQTKSEDVDVKPEEVEAYRNFCRAFVAAHGVFPQRDRYSFLEMLSHVATHLDSLLQLRLRQRQDGATYIKRLHKEAYNFALHATKVLLLAPTTFDVPPEMYSTDSLEMLRKTALGGNQLDDAFEKYLGESLQTYWRTDCGRIVSRMLSSEHGVSFCASMDGRPEHKLGRQVKMIIHCATGLAKSNLTYLRADARVICPRGKTICIDKTELDRTELEDDGGKAEWNDMLEITVPNLDSVNVVLELTGIVSGAFLQAKPMAATEVIQCAKENRQVWLPLEFSDEVGSGKSMRSLHPQLLVTFKLPTVREEIEAVREKWSGMSGIRTSNANMKGHDFSNSGLVSKKFGEAFLKAATELDGFIYFVDILFSQCLELAQLLGDLGMVLSVDMIRPLLDEIQHRLLAVNRAVLEELLNQVYDRITAKHRERSWHLFSSSPPEISPFVHDSSLKLQKLKPQLLTDIDSLRLLCCTNYDTAADVLVEAKAVVGDLMGRLTNEHTNARSSRFGLLPRSNVVEQITLQKTHKAKMTTSLAAFPVSPRSMSSGSSNGTGSTRLSLANSSCNSKSAMGSTCYTSADASRTLESERGIDEAQNSKICLSEAQYRFWLETCQLEIESYSDESTLEPSKKVETFRGSLPTMPNAVPTMPNVDSSAQQYLPTLLARGATRKPVTQEELKPQLTTHGKRTKEISSTDGQSVPIKHKKGFSAAVKKAVFGPRLAKA